MQSIDTNDTDEEDINNNNNTKHVEGVSHKRLYQLNGYIYL